MSGGSYPGAIAAGADGNLWFTEHIGNRIGRITPRGAVTEFPVGPATGVGPGDIAAGPDGNLWFTGPASDGEPDRAHHPDRRRHRFSAGISARPSPPGSPPARTATSGSPSTATNRIGRITPAGVVTEFSAGITGNISGAITAGPDGNLWFTESAGASGSDRIGRITPAGAVTEFPGRQERPRRHHRRPRRQPLVHRDCGTGSGGSPRRAR